MEKLGIFSGHAPELVTPGIHPVQQPPKLCRVAFDRPQVALRRLDNGRWDIGGHREETQGSRDGFEKLSTPELVPGFHAPSCRSIRSCRN
jgi:hypothetical protein